jgi:hypothetical protein
MYWLFLFPIAAFILLVGVIGVIAPRKRDRRAREGARNLATALGFDVLDGGEAARRVVPGPSAEAAVRDYEKIPAILRNLFESTGKATCITGTADGARITIFFETRGSGKSRTTYTVVRADYPTPLPFELHIAYEGTFIRLGKALFGLRDVEVGDEAFDRAVRVKTGDEAAARAALANPGARAAILGMIALSKEAFATNAFATWERQGRRFDPAEMRAVMAALVPVTRTLGSA